MRVKDFAAGALAVLAGCILTGHAVASPPAIVQLTHNTTTDFMPDVDDGRVVWRGMGSAGTTEIFLWDGSATTQISEDGGINETRPHISGSNVAWISYIDSDGEIVFWDGETLTQVTDDDIYHSDFCLDGSTVAWPDLVGGDLEIFLWDGATTTQLTDNFEIDSSPWVSGANVIWTRQFFDGSDPEVVFWDGSSETRLTDNAGDDEVPRLDGTKATWFTWEDADWHIYYWDGTTATRIESAATDERFPDISGTRVVWTGRDGSAENDTEVYLWDGGEVVQLTDDDADEGQVAVSGTQVVWVADADADGDYEIYLATVPFPTRVPTLPAWGAIVLAPALAWMAAQALARLASPRLR